MSLLKKKNWITFVGKLNKAKGYDVFVKSITKVLDKYKDWNAIVIGDEKEKISLNHKKATILGFKNIMRYWKFLRKLALLSLVLDGMNRLAELFEASANGCAVIITNKGGLPETVTDAKILQNLNEKNLTKSISNLIEDTKTRKSLQKNLY